MILLVSEDRRFLELWRSLLREHLGPGDHAATCARLADALGLAERGRLSLCVVDTLSPLHTTLGADGELDVADARAHGGLGGGRRFRRPHAGLPDEAGGDAHQHVVHLEVARFAIQDVSGDIFYRGRRLTEDVAIDPDLVRLAAQVGGAL